MLSGDDPTDVSSITFGKFLINTHFAVDFILCRRIVSETKVLFLSVVLYLRILGKSIIVCIFFRRGFCTSGNTISYTMQWRVVSFYSPPRRWMRSVTTQSKGEGCNWSPPPPIGNSKKIQPDHNDCVTILLYI